MPLTKIPASMADADMATQAELDAVSTVASNAAIAAAAASAKQAGDIVQIVHFQTGAKLSGAVTLPQDDTIPQITEGYEFLSQVFTPTNAANSLLIDVCLNVTCNAANTAGIALFQNGVSNALAAIAQYIGSTNAQNPANMRHQMTAGTTSPITFSVRAGTGDSSTLHVNGLVANRLYGGVVSSHITITEIKA
jgi:hypothetical protein